MTGLYRFCSLLFLFVSVFTASAFAHPGPHHEDLFATLAHLLSQPDHLAMLAIALILGAAGAIAMGLHAR